MGFFKRKDEPVYALEELDVTHFKLEHRPTNGFRTLRVMTDISGTDEDLKAFALLCTQKFICEQNRESFTKDMAANTLSHYYSMPEKKSNVIYKMALEYADEAYPYLLQRIRALEIYQHKKDVSIVFPLYYCVRQN